MENKTIKNKNLFIDDYISENDDEFENINTNDDNEYDYEYENYQHLINTIELIQKEILNYVEKKSIPLCEYLSNDNIEIFITNLDK